MTAEIGRLYKETLNKAVEYYRNGVFRERNFDTAIIQGKEYHVRCYYCIKKVKEKPIQMEVDDAEIHFHKNCIEFLVITSQLKDLQN